MKRDGLLQGFRGRLFSKGATERVEGRRVDAVEVMRDPEMSNSGDCPLPQLEGEGKLLPNPDSIQGELDCKEFQSL